ncbi:MAG TPA: hypothetical protein VKV95_07195 [Terriglobia bacterium]|nr:hypothetical protein [Terriglobia bacterium]
MDDKERSQFVDDLLEASLSRYSSVTPRSGLEGRVLANAKAAQERRTWFLWAGWLAAGAIATLIFIGIFTMSHRSTIPAPPKTVEAVKPGVMPDLRAGTAAVPPMQQTHAPRRPQVKRSAEVTLVARTEMRLPVFPSPAAITNEEMLLVQYIHVPPAGVLSAPVVESANIPEIQIKELEIPPLAEETADSTNEQ